MDIYTYMEKEGDGGEGSWCCVEEGGSPSLVCASALALVGVCVSSTGVTPLLSLSYLSFFLSLKKMTMRGNQG